MFLLSFSDRCRTLQIGCGIVITYVLLSPPVRFFFGKGRSLVQSLEKGIVTINPKTIYVFGLGEDKITLTTCAKCCEAASHGEFPIYKTRTSTENIVLYTRPTSAIPLESIKVAPTTYDYLNS
jgi:hypothetical protein